MGSTEAEKVEKKRQEADLLERERKQVRNMKLMFALFSVVLLLVLLLTFFLNR